VIESDMKMFGLRVEDVGDRVNGILGTMIADLK